MSGPNHRHTRTETPAVSTWWDQPLAGRLPKVSLEDPIGLVIQPLRRELWPSYTSMVSHHLRAEEDYSAHSASVVLQTINPEGRDFPLYLMMAPVNRWHSAQVVRNFP